MAAKIKNPSPWSALDLSEGLDLDSIVGLAEQGLDMSAVPEGQPSAQAIRMPVVDASRPSVEAAVKGSGMTEFGKNINRANRKLDQREAIYTSPEQMQETYEAVSGLPVFEQQAKGISEIEDLLRMEAQRPSQIDLSSLAALSDSLTGSKLLSAYARPDDKRKRMTDYMLKIQDDRKDLAKNISDFYAKQKSGTSNLSEFVEALSQKGAKSEDPSLNIRSLQMPLKARALKDLTYRFNKATEPFNDSLKFAQQAEALVNTTGPGSRLAPKALEAILARARTEVGNLSYYDQIGSTGTRDIFGALEQKFKTLTTGELTEENKKEILGLLQAYKSAANNALKSYREVFARQGSATYGEIGLDESDIEGSLIGMDTLRPRAAGKNESKEVAPPKEYDGSSKLPKDATPDMKAKRTEFLRKKEAEALSKKGAGK